MERTVILLKPDAIHRNLIGTIIARIESRNLKIIALKMMQLGKSTLDDHYSHLVEKSFYGEIVTYMTKGPVVAMVVEWDGVVWNIRQLCGATNPAEAGVGTIRAEFANNIRYNVIHASDSVESAENEIQRFFKDSELCAYDRVVIE